MDSRIPLESRLPATLAYCFIFLYGVHLVVKYFDVPILAPQEVFWNALVYVLPTRLLLDAARRRELHANGMLSQTHAAKSDALRRMLGLGGTTAISHPPTGDGLSMSSVMRRASTSILRVRNPAITSDAPAGLGNWDNSCYQNSVLQALTSLGSLRDWLHSSPLTPEDDKPTTNASLQEVIGKLRDLRNNGRHIWTPAKLKNMSSWQQQDAQEYFSKIMDELDKEVAKTAAANEMKPGLETLLEESEQGKTEKQTNKAPDMEDNVQQTARQNPLEGLVAQRVRCTSCGFSEGYSMIPFNCLTVPLGSKAEYELVECLDEYTKSEDIEGVECRSCTLRHHQDRLHHLKLPPELRGQIAERIQAIEQALADDDFSDKTLKQDCQIPAKAYISSTKSKEAIIGRAPCALVVHVNRSVFDGYTGMQRKNYAQVRYPLVLDLRKWMLSEGNTPARYRLSAVIQHYGRHENGHYICYRRHPRTQAAEKVDEHADTLTQEYDASKERWWRLSDEDVSEVSEAEALNQGGVFMLFYERLPEPLPPRFTSTEDVVEAASIPLPADDAAEWDALSELTTPSLATSSVVSESDTDYDEDDVDQIEEKPVPAPATPVLRTAAPAHMMSPRKDMGYGMGLGRSIMSV